MEIPFVTETGPDASHSIVGVASVTADSHVRRLYDNPALAFAGMIGCCEDGCVVQPHAYAMSVAAAGFVIAVLTADAKRQGLGVALQAAIDQAASAIRTVTPDA